MVAAWEMQIERKHRPRGMRSDAVNTSFVLVAKKGERCKEVVEWNSLEFQLEKLLAIEHERLSSHDWSAEDVGRSLFGIAVCRCAQLSSVCEGGMQLSTLNVLRRVAERVQAFVPEFHIEER